MAEDESSWVELGSEELRVKVNPLGAQLSVLQDRAGRDLLWNGDPAVWAGRAPWLFPIVGALAGGQYRYAGKRYALPRHGFARGKLFEVIEARDTSALFRLKPDPGTRAVYPFDFELDIRFEVDAARLSLAAVVRNRGGQHMPASFGFHPAFRWPLPAAGARAAHLLEFATEEPAPVRRLNADGLVTPTPHPTPVRGRILSLNDELFRDDAMILDQIRSRRVRFGTDTGRQVEVSFPRMPYLGLWNKPGASFICIEPWHGIADPEGFDGDLTGKPGVFIVAPGATHEFHVGIELTR